MLRLNDPSLPHQPRPEPCNRCRRRIRWTTALAFLASVSLASCVDDAVSPVAPDAEPALAASALTRSYQQVTSGYDHTCGLTTDGATFCWGSGLLGDGRESLTVPPQPVSGGLQFRQVRSGADQNCAVTAADRVYCWGRNTFGALGDGTKTDRFTPVPIGGTRRFRQVDIALFHGCGIGATDQRVYCWGMNTDGQLGDGTRSPHLTPVAVAGNRKFRQVAVDRTHSCALTTTGEAYCWGSNLGGRLGIGSTVGRRLRPTKVAGNLLFRQLDVGYSHSCAVTTNARALCWGEGASGELGDGHTSSRLAPVAVAGNLGFDRVTTGYFHTCAETTENRAYCWGLNDSGQLGDGNMTSRSSPVAVAGGLTFVQLSAGDFHVCGVTTSAAAYCWGWNWGGQLADLTRIDRSTPVPVTGES